MTKTLTQWMKENNYDLQKLADEFGYKRSSIVLAMQGSKNMSGKLALNIEKLTNGEVKALDLLNRCKELRKIAEQRQALFRSRIEL